MYIVAIKFCNSTIRLTSFMLEANHICLFSFPIKNTIQYLLTKNKRTNKKLQKNKIPIKH